jgi:anti-sigma factor RsiW
MKARIFPIDTAEHRAAQELMPWLVNRTLDADEASSVARHIAECARCQKDAAEQNALRAVAFAAESGGDVDRDWAVLRSRIRAMPPSPKPAPEISKPRWWKQWLPITVAVQAAIMLSLVLVLVGGPLREQRYRALGSPPAARAHRSSSASMGGRDCSPPGLRVLARRAPAVPSAWAAAGAPATIHLCTRESNP